MTTQQPTTIRLDQNLAERLELAVAVEGTTASAIIRDALTARLDQLFADPGFNARAMRYLDDQFTARRRLLEGTGE